MSSPLGLGKLWTQSPKASLYASWDILLPWFERWAIDRWKKWSMFKGKGLLVCAPWLIIRGAPWDTLGFTSIPMIQTGPLQSLLMARWVIQATCSRAGLPSRELQAYAGRTWWNLMRTKFCITGWGLTGWMTRSLGFRWAELSMSPQCSLAAMKGDRRLGWTSKSLTHGQRRMILTLHSALVSPLWEQQALH